MCKKWRMEFKCPYCDTPSWIQYQQCPYCGNFIDKAHADLNVLHEYRNTGSWPLDNSEEKQTSLQGRTAEQGEAETQPKYLRQNTGIGGQKF